MNFSDMAQGRTDTITELFNATFAASEGADEGDLVAGLARDLLTTTPDDDLRVFFVEDGGKPIGCIIFSRLRYTEDDRTVFLLSPVAVATAHQRKGVGQALLKHGLDALKAEDVNVVFTYGDPAYYGKVGFQPVTEGIAKAPCPLSMPHGWLAQTLDGRPLTPLQGGARCVPALNNPAYW